MKLLFKFFTAIVFSFLTCFNAKGADKKAPSVFKIQHPTEPTSLDPQKQKSASSNYLMGNLYRNFYKYEDDKGLVLDLAESCKRVQKSLICKLKKDLQWSDGSPITSTDFTRTYKKILDPENSIPRADLLFKIKNAQNIYKKQKSIDTLGISAPDPQTIKFEFEQVDLDFEYKLANFILAPTKTELNVFSGPYKVKEWKKGQKLILESNFKYKNAHSDRPLVEYLFISEDAVALQLYEKNELQFLRRLPTIFISRFKPRKDFHWIPVIRLDYVGFGPELSTQEDVRKALIYSLNYPELQQIFSAEGLPGCIGLPDSWFPNKAPCFNFDLTKIPELKKKQTYSFLFSALGGEDHKRGAEWMQDQWKKNAKLKVNLLAKENKTFLSELQQNPPALFRKGAAPDSPTCLSALELFSQNNPENFIHLSSSEYEKNLDLLRVTTNNTKKKMHCLKGVELLMNSHLFIPMGPIHFAILVNSSFKGWKLNQMNQLDLSDLYSSP